jgi:mobilization protein MobC
MKMPGQTGTETRRLDNVLTTRWSDDQFRYLQEIADLMDCSRAEVLRLLVGEAHPKVLPTKDHVREIQRIGVNLNQIARVANSTNRIDQPALDLLIEEIRAALKAMKR